MTDSDARGSRPWLRYLAVFVALGLVATFCATRQQDDPDPVASNGSDDPGAGVGTDTQTEDDPLRIRLRPGQSIAQTQQEVTQVQGTPLPQERIDAVTDRLDPLTQQDADRQAFNRPAESLPPPTAGEVIATTFPAADSDTESPPPAQAQDGPLEVVRFQPDGEVDIAPTLSVTFNQPMIPLATLDQLDGADVPVRVTPELDGRWRWIGTRTLRFEPAAGGPIDRLPMATEFTVTIPAGTRSAAGNPLTEDVTFSFATPPPQIRSFAPQGDSLSLTPVFVAQFDQLIEPDVMLDSLSLDADGDRPLRLATAAEIEADDTARDLTDQALDGRWLAFTPTEPLPADTPLTVAFDEGAPSAEGPRTTTAAERFEARTFPPLAVVRRECGYQPGCPPGQPLLIGFSNPLDSSVFDPQAVDITPEIPGVTVSAQFDQMIITGATVANTTYQVTLPAELQDERGQTLGTTETLEFDVGEQRPFLSPLQEELITLDPMAQEPTLSVVSAGHEELRVVALRVDPDDWDTYAGFDRYDESIDVPDFPVVFDRVVPTGSEDGATTETIIDLSEALPEGIGHTVVFVESLRTFPARSDSYWENRPTLAWVQATHLGVDALTDQDRLVVWATDLRDGQPIVDAEIDYDGEVVATDADGLAVIDLDSSGAGFLTATAEGQTALLSAGYSERWQAQARTDVARWYVFDDRGLYRPGETLHLKGWVRRLQLSGDADLSLLPADATVTYEVYDGQYAQLASGELSLGALGGFDLALDIPEGANLGYSVVTFQISGVPGLQDAYSEHAFQIQEFRRPEFEVTTRAESAEPHVVTRPVTVAAEATYFAGGGLPDAPVTWTVTNRDTTYAPPGWQDFAFGPFVPWWYGGYGDVAFDSGTFEDGFGEPIGPDETTTERLSGVTDAEGRHFLEIEVQGDTSDQPVLVSANAAVEDVNRQSFAATTDLLVHSGERYLGLRSDRAFVRQGDPLRIAAVLTDIDGAAILGEAVTVTAERLVQELVDGEYTERGTDTQTCELTSTDQPEQCEFTTDVGGRYRISGTVTDPDGGSNLTELEVWVSGGDAIPSRLVTQEQLTLIPAQQEYVAGDTAEILVPAPFSPATALVTISRNGIDSTQVIEVDDGSAIVEIPLTDDMIPGIQVQVDLVGTAPRLLDDGAPAPDLPDRPAYASGTTQIAVPPTSRTLTVDAVPRDPMVRPGASTAVDVVVTDADGNPVEGADVAVAVVDEAVLSLIGHEVANPVDSFYADLGSFIDATYLRRTVQLSRADGLTGEGADDRVATTEQALGQSAATEEAMDEAASADGDGGQAGGLTVVAPAAATEDAAAGTTSSAPEPVIEVRSDFDALAVFEPSVLTDAAGSVTVDVDLPDNLTRYRIVAVAAFGEDHFGRGESTLTAQLPLQVRPSAPRFANFGDTFELPVVVQNQTEEILTADVVLETANLDLAGSESQDGRTSTGREVMVPAGDRVEVRFGVAVADVGTARFRATAVTTSGGDSDEAADSATVDFPVYTPSTSESFATYGVLDGGAVAQPLLTPEGVIPQFGGLEVTTSSTAVQALTDAVLYLSEYPYDSTDAFASRLLAVVALRDVLDAFDAESLPPAAEIDRVLAEDITALVGLQNDDGGWPVWERFRRTEPYHTIQAAHALIAARDAGYDVPGGTIDRALERLRTIETTFEATWSETSRQTLRAYAVHVRSLAGDDDPAQAADIYRSLADATGDEAMPLDAIAWLWPVVQDGDIVADIERTIANQVTETPSTATFVSSYGEDAHLVLGSERRTDGIILNALLDQQPDSDLIVKVVNGLIANQTRGRWDNVQENAFILLALKRYFDTFEAETPDFVARVWLGDLYAAEHLFEGRSADSSLTVVPTVELLAQDDPQIVVSQEGDGRLYYRLGLRTAPVDLQVDARDEGFVVQRLYEAVGDPGDVVRGDDGTWQIRPGAEVRVTITMVADSRRVNMALVDPLPAGLEVVNPALSAAPALPPDQPEDAVSPRTDISWYPTWFDHQNLRDDRVEAFSGNLQAGTYEYSYIARATTPGTFVVPPTRAEEIYTPEVFGRSASDLVLVRE